MQSQLSGQLRTALVVLASLAVVSIVVMAAQGPEREAPADATAVAAGQQEAGHSGQCADCPSAVACEAASEGHPAGPSVDAERCIGCARCVNVSPEAFRMNPDTGKAEIIEGASAEDIAVGARACPVHAVIR